MSRAEPASVTSRRTATASPLPARTSSTVSVQSLMSATTTFAPAAARLRANSRPSPRAAPVIATTLSRTSMAALCSIKSEAEDGAPERVRESSALRPPRPSRRPPGSDHLVGARVNQVHVVEVGDERHRLAGIPGRLRRDAPADFGAVDDEIDHRLHAHRLDDIELRLEHRRSGRNVAALF